jgi:putative heme iron utilization protein
MLEVLSMFCKQVGAVPLGVAARSSQLSISMGEKLLRLHMNNDSQRQEARVIAEKLTKDFFHHGYPVNRTEAAQIGLKISERDKKVESLMWEIWCDISEELNLRKPFVELEVLKNNPKCSELFSPIPHANIPANLPQQIMQQVTAQVLAQTVVNNVPASEFETIHAIMESSRKASRYVTNGIIFGSRTPEMEFKLAKAHISHGWKDIQFTNTTTSGSKKKTNKKKIVVSKKTAKI